MTEELSARKARHAAEEDGTSTPVTEGVALVPDGDSATSQAEGVVDAAEPDETQTRDAQARSRSDTGAPWWKFWPSPKRLLLVSAGLGVLALILLIAALSINATQPKPTAMSSDEFSALPEHTLTVSIDGTGTVSEVEWSYMGNTQFATDVELPWSAEVTVPAAQWDGAQWASVKWAGVSGSIYPAITADGQIVRDTVADSDGSLSTTD